MTEPRTIDSSLQTIFSYDYQVVAPDMRRLYENAKRDQWNASRDIPWDAPGDPDGRIVADELIDIHGGPFWQKLSERDCVELNRHWAAWRLSVLLYGEHGALLACSQLVDLVP
ncbi:MAG: diiron oxygenase, partial [Candidatus Methylomirabilia bacterium]